MIVLRLGLKLGLWLGLGLCLVLGLGFMITHLKYAHN